MNQCLIDLFNMPEKRNRFATGLPTAFDIVRQQMPKGSPAVGIPREHVIIGFFVSEFGEDCVNVPESGTNRRFDVEVCGHGLLVHTKTNYGPFKISWTSDTQQARRKIKAGYYPTHDILLINIFWGQRQDSVFYIPLSVQQYVFNLLGSSNYLQAKEGTNHRGVEIKGSTATRLKRHPDTLKMQINWVTDSNEYPKPWKQWEDYWNQPGARILKN